MNELILSKVSEKNFVYKSFMKGFITTVICFLIIWIFLGIVLNGDLKQYSMMINLLFFSLFSYSLLDYGLAILVARKQFKLEHKNSFSLSLGIFINVILILVVLYFGYHVFQLLNIEFYG